MAKSQSISPEEKPQTDDPLLCVKRQRHTGQYKRHGGRHSKTYVVWASMIQRCLNPRHKFFSNYGGRGITVDPRWLDYRNFLADMGEQPPKKSLDRRDNNKGYSKENCRWATGQEQQRNTRKNRLITFQGLTMCISAWAEHLSLNVTTIHTRLRRGWSVDDALSPNLRRRPK